ncbi:AI-2E family transporter [Smaragdicoccus niigatensis]|uniref:AI-2E family transporter n=1 Tax=Smaragdicoccus niigatensis TaxID=359359 RepID=UPI000477AADE
METAEEGHGGLVGQPHTPEEGELIIAAEADATRIRTSEHPLGEPGRRFDRRSPFMIGMFATAGVAVTYGAIELMIAASDMLILIAISLFLAVGLEPVVSRLVRPQFPRWAAVTAVFVVVAGLFAGFLAAAIPPLVTQGVALFRQAPGYVDRLAERYPVIGSIESRFHVQEWLQQSLGADASSVVQNVLGAGEIIFSVVGATVIVVVLTGFFMANFPQIRTSTYRLFPRSRRPRAILLGDVIFAKVGSYILGNVLISVVTAVLTFVWLLVFDVPYPLLLAVLVAVLDLIPIVGSTMAGIIVALVTLTVSLPVTVATIVFFVALRLIEDYLLVPKIIGRAVEVPPLVTVVAVLLGGALLGIVGALLAIPIAAAVLLLVRETVLPQLDSQK